MEKVSQLDDDPSSLTSFNFIPEGDEEGLISKIFSKFKTAVSGPNQQLQQQLSSPSSSTRTISIVLSNESGTIIDEVAEQPLISENNPLSSSTAASSVGTITPTNDASVISTSTASAITVTTANAAANNSSNAAPIIIKNPPIVKTASSSSLSPAIPNNSSNSSSAIATAITPTSTITNKPSAPTTKTTIATATEIPINKSDKKKPTVVDKRNTNKGHITPTITRTKPIDKKHIVIDEDQNQQQQISGNMFIPLTKTSSIDSDTQSVMTTFSVSNTNSLSRILNRLRGGETTDSNKDFWMPDEQCKECFDCNAPFNLFRRKHHCRTCGRIFCSRCLSKNIHTSQSLRVCNDCYIKFVEGYCADDTISLHDGYTYSSVVVDANLSSSLQQQQHQQKTFLIPTSGDDNSSDEEIEFDRSTNSFDLQQRPTNLDLHFSQSTSSHHTMSDTDVGFKKLLTNTFLRTTPRSRTSTMNSLGIDTSLATLEGVRQQQQQQQQMNSPMPFRRNSFVVATNGQQNQQQLQLMQQDAHNTAVLSGPHNNGGTHTPTPLAQQGDYYETEDDDLRRWDKNPRNLLNFWGSGERPGSGIFNNIFFEDYADSPAPATPMMSTSTSTINKASSWFMRPANVGNPSNSERSNSIMRRRLSLTENGSNSNLFTSNGNSGSNNAPNNNSCNNSSNMNSSNSTSTRHVRVRTKSLMRNTPITTASMIIDQSDNSSNGGYESPSNRNSFHQQQITPSTSTPTASNINSNRSTTPEMDQLRIVSASGVNSHIVEVATHQQWDASFIQLMRNIIRQLLEEGELPRSDWEEVMMNLLLKIADEVQPHIRIRESFNMNHYVKIKKVPGGLPKDSFSVSGVVLSKCVAHKDMMRNVKNPLILILNFDVDGFGTAAMPANDGSVPRQEYLKFDRLLAWERDHMNALVSEIVGLKPSIVLVAGNVPRTIIECLNKAKIVVAYNIKKQKLDAIARCADATVFHYKNELWNAKTITPGKCGLFEPMTVMHEYLPNRRKTFLMFHECPKERGATIMLRGGDLKTLHTVKFIMNFMVKVVNNINLEAQLRKDFIELRRWNQSMYDNDRVSLQAGGTVDEDVVLITELGDDDSSSTLHQYPRANTGGRSISHHGESSDMAQMDTLSVSALSVAESQITVNTLDVIAAKKKSQQQYQQSTVIVEDDDICLTAINAVLHKYQNTTLSMSPGVSLPVPHILLKLRESQKKLIGLIRERLGVGITGTVLASNPPINEMGTAPNSPSTEINNEKQQPCQQNKLPPIPPIPTDLFHMLDYLKAFDPYLEHDLEYRHYQELHLQSWVLFKRYIGGIHHYLSPIYSQNFLVRRTTNPMDDHTIPCEKAALDPYDYYNPMRDCTLGQYILNSTKEAYTKCSSKMCGGPLIFHDRTYSHGNAQIKVQVFLEDDNGDEDMVEEMIDISRDEFLRKIPIFICTHCNICNVTHNWKPMSDLLQRYSFGKFLELLFYQSEPIPLYDDPKEYTTGYFGNDSGGGNGGGCPHGFYRDHMISFRIQNLSVNFTHAMVKVVDVYPPPLHLWFSSKQQMAIKDASLDSTRSKIAKFFDSIIERNKGFSYDIVQPNMVDLCKEYLQELSQEALKNKKNLLQKLQMEYATSAPTDTLQLNNVLADLQNHAVTWDLKYIDFARRFVRPERELRRLTTNHLRKMFPAESLYNSMSANTPVVSNLNLRTKRAIEAADLPLLDVELDNHTTVVPYGVSGTAISDPISMDDANNFTLKKQPGLGESPTESYPWYDELKRFDQMFLQDNKEDSLGQEIGSSVDGNQPRNHHHHHHHHHHRHNHPHKDHQHHSNHDNETNASNLTSPSPNDKSFGKLKIKQRDDDDSRDLDPSVARRLSLELMKDAPKKKKEQQQVEDNKKQQKRTTQKYLQESSIVENVQQLDTTSSTVSLSSPKMKSSKQSPPSTPNPASTSQPSDPVHTNQSRLGRHAAAIPILSSTAYKRLAGLLPDPMVVGKSKSSPSPGNYLPSQQQRVTPYQKLIEKNKANHRKSQFYEPTMIDDATTAPAPPQPNKPIYYRGSHYTTEMLQDRSAIAYRYGFMGGLNGNMPLGERRLGATNITHPVSTALATTNASILKANVSTKDPSSSLQVVKRTGQELDIVRPRSRTNNTNSKLRVGGRIPIPSHTTSYSASTKPKTSRHRYSISTGSGGSHLPIPISNYNKLPEGSIRQRLPSKASLEPYTKIKEIMAHDDDCSSSSSSSSSDEEDELLLDETLFGEKAGVLSSDEDEEDDVLPFQHKTFSLVYTDEYDESLGREMVPSIAELQEFHREHQLQMSNNTLPFLSVECGMVLDKKEKEEDAVGGEHQLSNKASTATMIDAVTLLRSSGNHSIIGLDNGSGSSNLDWSTNSSGRNSIMKAITYVLAEKSINNLTPLEYPFSPNEHIFADSNILVRENEPSSIISYMLGSTFYNEKLQRKQELRMSKAASSDLFNEPSKEKINSPTDASPDAGETKTFFSQMFPETDERERPWRFTFQGGSTSFSCKIYFAEQFDMLRKSCGCDEIFISSLARCTPWDTAGGKSGSIFLKTKDERFLIKQISKFEMDAFLGSANKYFIYMFDQVFDKGTPTVLCKIFGLYRIGFYNNVSGKSMKMDILVMENLFYDTSVKKVYDLKGSMRNRYAEKTGKDVEVFLDENLVELISKTPLYMQVDTKYNLSDSLYNDTHFLLDLDVMDYSLLVGFDEDTDEIIVGIVDFIRTFTWDKKLESWVKESGMLGGGMKEPTIVSPKMYRKRFRSAIDLYFCMIPDVWTLNWGLD